MSDERSSKATLVASKVLPAQIRPNLISCCPTMDLVAFTTVEDRVEVYRFGGQRAFVVQRKEQGISVESLCWKYNGQYLAVSWSDGIVDVVSSETGGMLQNFRQVTSLNHEDTENARSGPVLCLGWGLSLVDPHPVKTLKSRPENNELKIDSDGFLDRIPNLDALGLATELPDQLAQFDATDLMPKLPALPVIQNSSRSGKQSSAEIFASQASLDSVLHKGSTRELHAVNTFLLTEPEGSLRVILYDSLGIGNVTLENIPVTSHLRYLKHTSHPLAHCHVLLSEVSFAGGSTQLALVPLALRFLRFAGKNVHFIDFKTSQLEMLVQYIGECLQSMHHHWKHSMDLPSRFQQNIQETLDEKGEPNLIQSLYQFAAMGYYTPAMKEWVLDELGDRGHKRWEHAVHTGYTKVLELLQECLLPALDRCSVVICSLQGLAQYHEHSPAFDVSISSFSIILDIIKCIRLIAHHLVVWASEEFQRFNAFSAWLKHMIAVLRADPATVPGEDLYEDDPNIEYHFVLAYIEGPMQKSKLDSFLSSLADAPTLTANPNIYGETKKALEGFKQKPPVKNALLSLPSYFLEWRRHNKALIEQITAWQRSNTIMPGGFVLVNGRSKLFDLRMVSDKPDDSIVTYVLSVVEGHTSTLKLFKVTHSRLFDEIPKSIQHCEATEIEVGQLEIMDAKFLDDNTLILLLRNEEEELSHLIQLPYRRQETGNVIDFQPVQGSLKDMNLLKGAYPRSSSHHKISDASQLENYIRETFNHKDDSFEPVSCMVTGRMNRKVCVILAEDGRQTRIYDLNLVNSNGFGGEGNDSDVEMS